VQPCLNSLLYAVESPDVRTLSQTSSQKRYSKIRRPEVSSLLTALGRSLTLRLTEETLQKAVKEVKAYVSMSPFPVLGVSSSLFSVLTFDLFTDHICGLILAKFLLLDTPSGREECHVAVNRIILPRVYKPLFNLYVGFVRRLALWQYTQATARLRS
jgi:hypothetical protein